LLGDRLDRYVQAVGRIERGRFTPQAFARRFALRAVAAKALLVAVVDRGNALQAKEAGQGERKLRLIFLGISGIAIKHPGG
jgi:hypothetical protein